MLIPIAGFQYTFWRMNMILDSVPESELVARTRGLPEVEAFLEKYEKADTYIDTDFHIGVIYSITECRMTGKHCGESRPHIAYLDIRINLDTGYPQHSIFWCKGDNQGRAPIGDENGVQSIKSCA